MSSIFINNIFFSGGPEYHKDLVKKLQATVKSSQKTVQKLSRELACNLAKELNSTAPNQPQFYFLNRNDGVDMDFATTFLKNVKIENGKIFFFITIADGIDSKSGSLLLHGDAVDVEEISKEVTKILDGKGNGKNGRFQAKVTKLNKIKECEAFVRKFFENKSK